MRDSENEGKKQVVTCAEMKEIEREANANGLSYYQMMENAGTAAADIILSQETEPASLTAVIFCGKGNNGGDGYVVARRLSQAGMRTTVIEAEQFIHDSEMIVDAIYGTGFHGQLSAAVAECARRINNKKSRARIYALDILLACPAILAQPPAVLSVLTIPSSFTA